MKKLRKIFTASVMAITILSMSVVAVPARAAVAQDGDLIKTDSNSAVYYLKGGKRYVFPNEATYFSWYADWNNVVVVSKEEIANYPLQANITMRPGTKLVKSPNDLLVYAVEPGGKLRSIVSEANAIALFGANWAKNVVDIIDSLFVSYKVGAPLTLGQYPEGSLVKSATDPTVYYIDADGKARKFADGAAFLANRFQWKDIMTAATIPAAGSVISGEETAISDTAQGAGGSVIDPTVGSGLMASISASTPAAGNVPAGATVEFLKFNLTAANDGNVTVNSINLSAYDLGDATDIQDITFYDNGVKVGTAKDMGSDRVKSFSFSGGLVISAGTTKTLTVKAKLDDAADSNYALGVKSASAIVTNGAAVSGSFPIIGNTKAAVDSTIGEATVSNSDGTPANAEFGDDDVLLASFNVDTANEPINWESAMFTNAGDSVVSNLRINIDGEEIATADMDGETVTFELDNYLIDKGESVSVEVYGDISGTDAEADDTVQLYINDSSDFVMTGQDYGYGVSADVDDLDKSDAIIVTVETGDVTLDIDKSATTGTPAKDIEADKDDVVIATFSVKSNGSDAIVNEIVDGTAANSDFMIELRDAATSTDISELLENIELRDKNGGVYDLTVVNTDSEDNTDASGDLDIRLSLDEEISLANGVAEVFEVRLDTLEDMPENATLTFVIEGGAFDIETEAGDAIADADITGGGNGALMTVKGPSADWTTKSLTAKTVVPGAQAVQIYKATLEVGDVSDVKISSIKFTGTSTPDDVFGDDQISSLELWIDGAKVATKSGSIVETGNYINFTSLNKTVAAGKDVSVELIANFSSSFTNTGMFAVEITAEGDIVMKDEDNDAMSDVLVNAGTDSRLMTLQDTGSLKVELKTDDTKANQDTYILAGSSITSNDKYVGELELTTENEDIKLKTLVLANNGTATDADIAKVYLYNEAGEVVAYETPNASGHVNFDNLNLVLAADQTTSLFIGVQAKSINASGDSEGTATFGKTIQYGLATGADLTAFGLSAGEAVTAQGDDSGEELTMTEDSNDVIIANEYSDDDVYTKTTTVTGSLLTAVTSSLVDGDLKGGSSVIGEYKFVFDNGSNRNTSNQALKSSFDSLVLEIASSSVSLSGVEIYNKDNSSIKLAASSTSATAITFNDLDALEDVDGVVTLVVKATVTIDADATNYYLQTSIADLAGGDLVVDANGSDASGTISNPLLSDNEVEGANLD